MLIDLPPQSWFEAPGTHMREVCPPASLGLKDCTGVVTAWNSGAYDSVRRRMLIWGGGHDDYYGNELYAFELQTGTWARITEPSVVPAGSNAGEYFNRDPLSDGQPVSRHTYDCLEFLPDLDLLWSNGGSRATDGGGTRVNWFFDANTGWSQRAQGFGGFNVACAYDAASRRIFMTHPSLSIYDVDTDAWTPIDAAWGFPPLWPRYGGPYEHTATIDTRRGLLWMVGGWCTAPSECVGTVLVWDTAAGQPVTDDWVTTGGGAYTNRETVEQYYPEQIFESGGGVVYYARAPGFDYDSAADDLVAWPNFGAPYALDLDTKEWTIGSDVGAPAPPNTQGTYGRWRYIDAYNVFILVTSVDENVYFYKHTSGCGPG
jgi:hypothetical protein